MNLPLINGASVAYTNNTALTTPFKITIKNNNSTHSDVLAQAASCLPILHMHGVTATQYMLTHQATAV
jgi:hypothetical protein